MVAADLAFANSLRAAVGWNQTIEDWRRLLAMEPTGCFVAELDGTPAGTATTTVYGHELAWIGMVLVRPELRRRGVGRALLRYCLAHLRQREIQCIKLDATPWLRRQRSLWLECRQSKWLDRNAFRRKEVQSGGLAAIFELVFWP